MNIDSKNLKINNHILSKDFKIKKSGKYSINVKKIFNDTISGIDKKKDTLHLFSKKFRLNLNLKKLKRYKKFKTIVLIGMGGSILGAKAIYSYLEHKINKKFIFIDNLDEKKLMELKKLKFKKVLFIIISKSGNTLETITNINLIFKPKFDFKNTIIITENKNNILNNFSKLKKIPLIEHKNYIGGRYSVLSEVGMLPAFLMGLNINQFRKNILTHVSGKNKNKMIANISSLCQVYSSKKINSIIFLNYDSKLNDFIYWSQQLISESLGKKGKGILPVLSFGPKDHHSLLQLFLDGPKDKLFYIFSGKGLEKNYIKNNFFKKSLNFLNNKSLDNIIQAQKDSLTDVFKRKKISFKEIISKNPGAETLGELFSYFIIETIIIGKCLKINPFNQPAVDEVKKTTKKLLS